MERELNEIQKILNGALDDTKKNWGELKTYSKQLQQIEDKTNDIQMGGIKMSELNKSMEVLTQFLEGAFKEVNNSVQNLSTEIAEHKKKAGGGDE